MEAPPSSSSPASLEDEVDRLRKRIEVLESANLQARLLQLEAALRASGVPVPAPQVGSAPATAVGIASPVEPPSPVVVSPVPFAAVAGANAPAPSLESRIGSQWFNRIGILAVLIAASWFLKLAIDRGWIGPSARVLIGLVAGAAIFAGSEPFARRGYAAFSYSLRALGAGILYLSLCAASSFFPLVPAPVAFLGMVAVTGVNGLLAWRNNSELLAFYGIVGGFSTPGLLASGRNEELFLFSYLLLLDLALAALTTLRPWARLVLPAGLGTAVYIAGWWVSYSAESSPALTACFITLFYLLFALVPRLLRPRDTAGQDATTDTLALVLSPTMAGALGFAALRSLSLDHAWLVGPPALALLFAGVYSLASRAGRRTRPLLPVVQSTYLALAVFFFSLALGLKLHGRTLPLAWMGEGAVLLTVAARARSALLQLLGSLTVTLGLGTLLLPGLLGSEPPTSLTPLLNARFAACAVAVALLVYLAKLARNSTTPGEGDTAHAWHSLALVTTLLANGVLLLAFGREVHAFWWYAHWRGDFRLVHDYRMYAQFTYSALFMVFGAVLLAFGFARSSALARWQALVLLAFTVGKVFLVDLTALSEGYRILSFLGLGALLLAVSFIYQRDWLRLRHPES